MNEKTGSISMKFVSTGELVATCLLLSAHTLWDRSLHLGYSSTLNSAEH